MKLLFSAIFQRHPNHTIVSVINEIAAYPVTAAPVSVSPLAH